MSRKRKGDSACESFLKSRVKQEILREMVLIEQAPEFFGSDVPTPNPAFISRSMGGSQSSINQLMREMLKERILKSGERSSIQEYRVNWGSLLKFWGYITRKERELSISKKEIEEVNRYFFASSPPEKRDKVNYATDLLFSLRSNRPKKKDPPTISQVEAYGTHVLEKNKTFTDILRIFLTEFFKEKKSSDFSVLFCHFFPDFVWWLQQDDFELIHEQITFYISCVYTSSESQPGYVNKGRDRIRREVFGITAKQETELREKLAYETYWGKSGEPPAEKGTSNPRKRRV